MAYVDKNKQEKNGDSDDMVEVCRICLNSILKGKTPPLAEINSLEVHKTPSVLKDLNSIERMLIQKARVIQKVVVLKDVGQRPTKTRASGGAMVVCPTTITKSVNHVLRKLPSAELLKIVVETAWGKKYIVCMGKIVKALEWLKTNNREYADVEIDREFKFKIGENIVFEDSTKGEKDVEGLVRASEDESGLMLIEVEEVKNLQTINQLPGDDLQACQRYALQELNYDPINKKEKSTSYWAFPHLWPFGKNGMFEDRQIKISESQYLRSILLNKSRQFVLDIQYLCYAFARKIQNRISSVQGVQARMPQNATSKSFSVEDPAVAQKLSSVYNKIRGFRQYWKSVRNRLQFYVGFHGPPTFYMTLNPNETDWRDLHNAYSLTSGKTVDAANIREQIELDPIPLSRYFQKRVRAFFKNIVLNEDGPLGEVVHYFYRIEYQCRGSPHVYCLLWCKDGPDRDADPEVLRSYIDKYLTARMPSEDETKLRDLVKKHQAHYETHSGTCLRFRKVKGKLYKRCRFLFPRPCRLRTAVNSEQACGWKLSGRKSYELARKANEQFLNDYNSALLLAWEGNIDLQFVGTDKDVVNYVTSYASKGETAKNNSKKEGISMTRNEWIYQMGIDELNSREVGGNEMADELLGHENFRFDMSDTWIATDAPDERSRMLKPKAQVKDLDDSLYVDNLIDTYYPSRPEILEEYSLYNLATCFDVTGKKGREWEDDNGESMGCDLYDQRSPLYSHANLRSGDLIPIKGLNKYFWKRKQKVGRFFIPIVDEENPLANEDFYRRLCVLFIPWRDERKIMDIFEKTTYFETFFAYLEKLKTESLSAYTDVVRLVQVFRDIKKDQNNMTDKVTKLKGVGGKPFLKYISGSAGVGKTFLIETVANEVETQYRSSAGRPAVLLCAPTGLAAMAIKGHTIHSLLAIEVVNGADGVYEALRDDKRDLRRAMFENVRLLILDEISMVSSVLLAKIRNRLKEVMNSSMEFGGMNIIVLGDLLQLPPVKAAPVFEGLTTYCAKKHFGGTGSSINLWRLFEFDELTINMRQRADTTFSDLLARMRINKLNEEDMKVLASRVICTKLNDSTFQQAAEKFIEIRKNDHYAMALFPLRDDVDCFNKKIMEMYGEKIVVVMAKDKEHGRSFSNKNNQKKERPWQKSEFSILQEKTPLGTKINTNTKGMLKTAGGLDVKLELALYVRVMLRRNVDRKKGLVNGATGVITQFELKNDEVVRIAVRFDRVPDEIMWIEKTSAMFDGKGGMRMSRRQFPIAVAFAATIHKAQGLTLKNVIISTKKIFAPSQLYVATSRVTSLEGLFFVEFCPESVKIDQKAICEYDRLRALKDKDRMISTDVNDEKMDVDSDENSTVETMQFLSLVNRKTDCFVICAVNILHACSTIRKMVVSINDENSENKTLLKELKNVFNSNNNSVKMLRNSFVDRRLHSDQHDVYSSVIEIVKGLPPAARQLLSMKRKTEWKCPCGRKSRQQETKLEIIVRPMYRSSSLVELMTHLLKIL